MPVPIAVHGATGRVGQRLVALAPHDPGVTLAAAVSREPLPDSFTDGVVIDFSSPEGTAALLRTCVARELPVVIATTGFDSVGMAAIHRAAAAIPVLFAPNTSLVVNLLFKLTRLAAEALAGKGFDAEIVERHHRLKKDSPSGTAHHFARLCKEAMSLSHERHGREGILGERPMDEIGIHAVRTGDNIGEHTIIFGAPGETLELVHKGTSRDSYARGALLAAAYLYGKPAGAYTMADVLGL